MPASEQYTKPIETTEMYQHASPLAPAVRTQGAVVSNVLREAIIRGTVAVPDENLAFPLDHELDETRADDRAIAHAVNALQEGRNLVDITEVAEHMDRWHTTRRFAIAPATASGKVAFREWDKRSGNVTFRVGRFRQTLVGLDEAKAYEWGDRIERVRTVVPYIPPAIRTQFAPMKGKLIVWEAKWPARQAERIRMHIDPALVEHISGDLYTVLAVWDLTPLERAALGG